MALSNRELVMLELRAQDNASATINRVGASTRGLTAALDRGSLNAFAYSEAFSTVGRGMSRAGLAILATGGMAVKSALEFDHAMAIANTQAQLTTKRLAQLSDQVLQVSSDTGVAATNIADSLYDIFSTTDQTAGQAIKSVQALSKASVAGDVEMREATRGVIDIQNAFGKSAGNVTDILDRQFAMLRTSGGTYGELVSAFGNVIGAAKDMDQSVQSVSGAIAFLTLRGRTQAQASISVSRALDQIAKSADNIGKVLDVSVFDSAGKFRNLEDIVTDMGEAMEGMSSRERSAAFQEMFGQGSIQANRFFRVAIPQAHELNDAVRQLSDANIGGELGKQFQIIKEQDPTFVINKFKESVRNLGIELANTLMPDLLAIAEHLEGLADAFSDLDPGTQKLIARIAALAGVFLLVGGKALMFTGAILRMYSIFKLASGVKALSSGLNGIGTAATTASTKMQSATVATSKFRGAWTALKSVGAVAIITGLIIGIQEYIDVVNKANERSDKLFDKVEEGKKTYTDVESRLASLRAELEAYESRSTGDQLRGIFSGDLFGGVDLETQINRLNDRIAENREEMSKAIRIAIGSDEAFSKYGEAILSSAGLTDKQRIAVANMLDVLSSANKGLSDSARFTLEAAMESGNWSEVLRILMGRIRDVTGALKNLASSQERTKDKQEIYNQKQERAAHLNRNTTNTIKENTAALENQGNKALQGSGDFQRWGAAADNAGGKVKGATDKANDYVRRSPYKARIEAIDAASNTINNIRNMLENLERTYHARVEVIQGGSAPTTDTGGGGGGGGGGTGPTAPDRDTTRSTRRSSRGGDVYVSARTSATAEEIAHEVDWAIRTRGYG